eukprot:6190041-Pleurochrysis_carterae.AAC.3
MTRQSNPTAYATSGRVCVENRARRPPRTGTRNGGLARRARRHSLPQGPARRGAVGLRRRERGFCGSSRAPRQASRCGLDWRCTSLTFNKSDTGPSSSTFQRAAKSFVKEAYSESGSSWEYTGALPATPSLGHPVHGLGHAENARAPVSADRLVTRRGTAVHFSPRLKLALEAGGNEVPSSHGESSAGCE